MLLHTAIIFFREGDFMKLVKNMALMSMGAGAVLAYQKYNKPMMDKMSKMMTSMKKQASDKLEDMMQ
jgi:hypothetical protein